MLKIFDNHIPEELRNKLVHSEEYQNMRRQVFKFVTIESLPSSQSPIEQALHNIWKDVIDYEEYKDGVIEYWINKDKAVNGKCNANHMWHSDVYEPNKATKDKWQDGEVGCVYYPYVDCLGGFFELADNPKKLSDKDYKMYVLTMDPTTQAERFKAKTNRAIFIDPFRIHRVSKIYHGIRESLASTLWKKKPVDF